VKSQDILLMFKMASLRAQEEMAPSSSGKYSPEALNRIDLLESDFASDSIVHAAPPVGARQMEDVQYVIGKWADAMSSKWEGWEAADDPLPATPLTNWAECYSLRALSSSLGISKSEVSNSIARCREAGLVTNDYETSLPKVNRLELLKITEYALKYFFPVKPGAFVRGIPTGFAAPALSKHLKSAGTLIPVWPDPYGAERGQSIEPLYKTVPEAVKLDRTLYHYLALADAIRMGGPRESSVAVKLLKAGMGL